MNQRAFGLYHAERHEAEVQLLREAERDIKEGHRFTERIKTYE
jgi:hypothetical protein